MVPPPGQQDLQARVNVLDVPAPLLQVRVLHLREELEEAADDRTQRPLRVDLLLADLLDGLARERMVVEDEELGVEDLRVGLAKVVRDALAESLDLHAGRVARGEEALDLLLDAVRADGNPEDRRPLAFEDESLPHRDPGAHPDPLKPHAPSPNCPSTRPVSSRTASSSSSPSTRSRIDDPWLPARVSSPRIDFPSTHRPSLASRIFDRNRLARWTNRAAARACRPRRFCMTSSRSIMPLPCPLRSS